MDEQEAEKTVYHALEIKDLSIIADIKEIGRAHV